MRVAARPAGEPGTGTPPRPIGADEFARAMARLGPFESAPRLAVAVSGGRDSMALALLAAGWARARGGRIDAVTVDHGLRAGSAREAAQVGAWLGRAAIPHRILSWTPAGLDAGIEAAARRARYERLEAYCRAQGILHLLVGHHRADQRETLVMRRARASGPVGLAGMAAVRELAHMRVLRPLLAFPRERITATLEARGQDWIEDPSNADLRFARARLRAARDRGAGDVAGAFAGAARAAGDRRLARLAARAVYVHPAGHAAVALDRLRDADPETASRLVGNLVMCVAGRIYPPRGARLSRLAGRLLAGDVPRGATLGGCAVRPLGAGRILVLREFAAIAPPAPARAGPALWDARFVVTAPSGLPAGAALGAVGQFEALGARAAEPCPALPVPCAARRTLPAVCADGRIRICRLAGDPDSRAGAAFARFAPKIPVAGAAFGPGRE